MPSESRARRDNSGLTVLSEPMAAILECLDDSIPRTYNEVADMMQTTYWAVYPKFQELERLGYIRPHPFRKGKEKAFVKADVSTTPKIYSAGRDAAPVAIYNLAKGAPVARKNGTETGTWVNNFPYMILRLYNLAYSMEAGHSFDRAVFQSIRTDVVMLRNRLENMIGAVNELLAHPVMSGDSRSLTDALLADPNNPLDREAVSRLMKEAE